MLLNEAVNQFGEVKSAGHMPQFAAQVQKVFPSLGLCHNIQVTPKSQLQLAAAQEFQVTGKFADGATCSLGKGMLFAFIGSEERDDTVGFT